ncbi:hypothetical protein RI845_05235 [Thalassotalea nanhaiensis]|uniref:Polysaccharide biosynthesis protein n=1 Tax=Thalassotalea nanhaiensis TaxID=3065648 RepID=A0ABY9TLF2_9GAMM|nr:hypothetical protein RI845_05235 [Colwelliaceae bacterium SQ345]
MNFNFLLISNIFYVLVQFLVLSLFSKFYSVENVGEYFFALSISAPFMIFVALKLNNFVITNKGDSLSFSVGEIYFIRIIFTLLGCGLSLLFFIMFFQKNTSILIVLFVIIFKFTEQFDDVLAAYQSKQFNYKRFSIIKARRASVYLLVVLISTLLNDDFESNLFFSGLMYFICWYFLSLKGIKPLERVKIKKMLRLFKLLFPLGLSSCIQSLGTSGSRSFIGVKLGNSALAIFGSISYSITAINLVTNALGAYFLPHFSALKLNKHNFYKKIIFSQSVVFVLAIALLLLSHYFGEILLTIVFNEEIAEYHYGLFLLCISASLKASTNLIGTALISIEKYSIQVWVTSLWTVCLFVFIYLMEDQKLKGMFLAVLYATIIEWLFVFFISAWHFYGHFKKTNL